MLGLTLIRFTGHGSHTSALVGGATYGVAKGARIAMIRALDCAGNGQLSDIVLALMEVADRQACGNCAHPAVLSMSLSGPHNDVIDAHTSVLVSTYGVAVAVAAGNAGSTSCTFSPATASGVLSVAASTSSDELASFSNHGAGCTALVAPGQTILSAWYFDDASTRVDSGTSMATPQVAGALAILIELAGSHAGRGAAAQQQLLSLAAAGSMRIAGLPVLFVGNDAAPSVTTPTTAVQPPTTNGGGGGVPQPQPPPSSPSNPPPPPPPPSAPNVWWEPAQPYPPARNSGNRTAVCGSWVSWLVFVGIVLIAMAA